MPKWHTLGRLVPNPFLYATVVRKVEQRRAASPMPCLAEGRASRGDARSLVGWVLSRRTREFRCVAAGSLRWVASNSLVKEAGDQEGGPVGYLPEQAQWRSQSVDSNQVAAFTSGSCTCVTLTVFLASLCLSFLLCGMEVLINNTYCTQL